MLTRFKCGHVGRTVGTAKVKRFIRFAEIRREPVEDSNKHCPECKHTDESKV